MKTPTAAASAAAASSRPKPAAPAALDVAGEFPDELTDADEAAFVRRVHQESVTQYRPTRLASDPHHPQAKEQQLAVCDAEIEKLEAKLSHARRVRNHAQFRGPGQIRWVTQAEAVRLWIKDGVLTEESARHMCGNLRREGHYISRAVVGKGRDSLVDYYLSWYLIKRNT